jgi:hypothetical protein
VRRRGPACAAATLVVPVLLAACGGYVPPVQADRASEKFKTDVAACQKTGGKEADRLAWAFFFNLSTYAISLPVLQRREITNCMIAKGYALNG